MSITSSPASTSAEIASAFNNSSIEAFGMLIETHNEMLNAVTRRLDDTVALPVPWLGVLIRLARTPGQQLRMSELARDMTMSNSGLTRLIDRVEAAGHVRREACTQDRRGQFAVLEPEGLRLVNAALPGHVQDLQDYLAAPLSNDELVQLTNLLRRVRDHVRSSSDPVD